MGGVGGYPGNAADCFWKLFSSLKLKKEKELLIRDGTTSTGFAAGAIAENQVSMLARRQGGLIGQHASKAFNKMLRFVVLIVFFSFFIILIQS